MYRGPNLKMCPRTQLNQFCLISPISARLIIFLANYDFRFLYYFPYLGHVDNFLANRDFRVFECFLHLSHVTYFI